MATHSNGISALQLQRQLGLGSYRSAWLLCGKLRRSMVAPGRGARAGLIEVDETEIPCRSKNDPLTGGGRRKLYLWGPRSDLIQIRDDRDRTR